LKYEATELTLAVLHGELDDKPELKRCLESVLHDYEMLWAIYIAANIVQEQCAMGGTVVAAPTLDAIDALGAAIMLRNKA
jgi:hypothetical protein